MAGTAYVGGTLIDGTGAPPLRDAAVVARDGRITWVGPTERLDRAEPLDVVDVSGAYVLPGLLDANVHLLSEIGPDVLLRYDPGCYDELILEAAQVSLKSGITTVFDTWGPLEPLRRVRDAVNAGEPVASRFFIAGNIVGNGGPWSDFLPADLPLRRMTEIIDATLVERINEQWEQGVGNNLPWLSADGVAEAMREYVATSGVDFVKYAGSAHAPGKWIVFADDAQRAIVEAAHAAGLTAQACTQTPGALKMAIEAGVDLLQHGDITGREPMPESTLRTIVDRQLPTVAFLTTERYLASVPTDFLGGQWHRMTHVADQNGRRLIEAGAKLMLANDMGVYGERSRASAFWAGPDAPRDLGQSHIAWLKAAVERGLKPMDALLATTRNVAEGYGKLDELGTVEPGKHADLLVLDANPLDDPENYGRVRAVVKDGALVDRDRLPEHPVLTAPA
jgi:imidazolonepropionase-like amidohydrolase